MLIEYAVTEMPFFRLMVRVLQNTDLMDW